MLATQAISALLAMEAKPWENEPDQVEWIDRSTGYPCLVCRNRLEAYCGYVFIPKTHPAYGVDSNNLNLDAHGGITLEQPADEYFSGSVTSFDVRGMWVFGFDCAHCFDIIPAHAHWLGVGGKYRDLAYVTAEVGSLAKQLQEVACVTV
jgi:hypothetical protein